ncbi:MAG: phosphoglucosamine mutase [Alphaproteobacteria bacterium]|nr:phosphoglucosamine mutase [Alphaproteobacteria bacterium]
MTRKYFGTDGIRGKTNDFPMLPEIAMKVAMATAQVIGPKSYRQAVVIGKDTRLSGYMLEPALTAGFVSLGFDVYLVGPMPTPAVAMLTRSLRADLGVMISASHNPFEDNGIKIFGSDGYKLSDDLEHKIEALIENPEWNRARPENLGNVTRLEDARGRYIEFAKNTFPKKMRLKGLKIVLDCANGAAYKVAPTVLWELGAQVIPISVNPDGININHQCGAMHPEVLSKAVLEHKADLGIALDGDADRIMMVDEKGRLVDGDQIMALIAKFFYETNRLKGNGVVGTIMSNLGMERYLNAMKLDLVRAKVGDRYVMEKMVEGKYNVGGEQSGHIILTDYTTTGDGLIAALQTLAVLIEQNKPISEVCHVFEPVPQYKRNVHFSSGNPLQNQKVQDVIRENEARILPKGRLVIRPSGTEPVIRIMTEGEDENLIKDVAENIAASIEQAQRVA